MEVTSAPWNGLRQKPQLPLGRSLKDLIAWVGYLDEHGIGLRSLHEVIDTTTPTGKLTFHIFGAPRPFERLGGYVGRLAECCGTGFATFCRHGLGDAGDVGSLRTIRCQGRWSACRRGRACRSAVSGT